MKDVLGAGEILPIKKLLDLLEKVVGRVSKDYFQRKDIDAKAYEIKKLGIATAEVKVEELKMLAAAVKENFAGTGGVEYKQGELTISSPKQLLTEVRSSSSSVPLEERTKQRVFYQDAKRQQNIEDITAFAAEELANETPVTAEPVEENWANKFFRLAEDISGEEIKALWGRILAGEIKRPGTYSLRTLELLKTLSKTEAELFQRLQKLAIKFEDHSFILCPKDTELTDKYKTKGLRIYEILSLQELGLLNSTETVYTIAELGDIILQLPGVALKLFFPIPLGTTPNMFKFTEVGYQLLNLGKPESDISYIKFVASRFVKAGAIIKYGKIFGKEGEEKIGHFYDDLESALIN
jgi:uncharacterized repeat protein (TIGR03899 family)